MAHYPREPTAETLTPRNIPADWFENDCELTAKELEAIAELDKLEAIETITEKIDAN